MIENNLELNTSPTSIKVIGVGGAGANAVDHMISHGITGVDFVAVNTDSQALSRCKAKQKLQLGPGLGAGGKPDKARALAEEHRQEISKLFDNTHMVFITAGMGGGTGTGAAPVLAEIAKEKGILTVAIVTKPFTFEGRRIKTAEEGLECLESHVDAIIVILNDRLNEVLDDDISFLDAFKAADDVLKNAVGGIAEIINVPGLVNVDFEDVRSVMQETGKAMMGSALASGPDRAKEAAENALASPLLEGINLMGARGVLVNISASNDLKMKEANQVMSVINSCAAKDATVYWGTAIDDSLGDQLRVTIIAAGLNKSKKPSLVQPIETVSLKNGTNNMSDHVLDRAADFLNNDKPSKNYADVFTSNRKSTSSTNHDLDNYDIPAYLRNQAD